MNGNPETVRSGPGMEDLGQSIMDVIRTSADGVIDQDTLRLSQYVPARLREPYTFIRIYLLRNAKTASKEERAESIRSIVYNALRTPEKIAKGEIELAKYRKLSDEIFEEKKIGEEFRKFIDLKYDDVALDLAMKKVKLWDNIFLSLGKIDEEVAHSASGRDRIRYGSDNEPVTL